MRFSDNRIVLLVSAQVHGDSITASEEYGPFEGLLEVLDLGAQFLRGYLLGEFPDVLLSELSQPNVTKGD